VNSISPDDLSVHLRRRLGNARRIALVGIGDELSPADRLGMVAAREIEKMDIPRARVFLAGTVPESMTGPLRNFHPDHVILFDAADMGVLPGTIMVIDPEQISGNLLSSHVLPLSVVMEFIEQDSQTKVTLLGIQPDMTRPETGLSSDAYEYLKQNLGTLGHLLRDLTN
jgi:hydrogenase 3 maturation protease